MKIGAHVKRKSLLWNLVPWLSNKTAQAIYPNIYLPASIYDDLLSPSPRIWSTALLLHEQEHIKRQKMDGPFIWLVKYIFSARFRFAEELAADIPKLSFLKAKGARPYITKRARMLASWRYFWPVNFKTAKIALDDIWVRL